MATNSSRIGSGRCRQVRENRTARRPRQLMTSGNRAISDPRIFRIARSFTFQRVIFTSSRFSVYPRAHARARGPGALAVPCSRWRIHSCATLVSREKQRERERDSLETDPSRGSNPRLICPRLLYDRNFKFRQERRTIFRSALFKQAGGFRRGGGLRVGFEDESRTDPISRVLCRSRPANPRT